MTEQLSAGEILRSLRNAGRHSQAQVAMAAGITEGAVSQFETGRTSPSLNTAVKIDAYLDADGRVLKAFGYVLPTSPEIAEQLNALQQRVDVIEVTRRVELTQPADVEHRVTELELALKQAQDAIVALRKDVAELRDAPRAPRAAHR